MSVAKSVQCQVVMLVLAVCSGCGGSADDCRARQCFDGVEIRFEPPLSAEEANVFVSFDSRTIRCEAIDNGDDSCRSEGVFVTFDEGSVVGIRLAAEHPEVLTFSLSTTFAVLVSATVKPQYWLLQPNGSECLPLCNSGFVVL